MLKKIVPFGASNSRQSINKKLANFVANQIVGAEVNLLDFSEETGIIDEELRQAFDKQLQLFQNALEAN